MDVLLGLNRNLMIYLLKTSIILMVQHTTPIIPIQDQAHLITMLLVMIPGLWERIISIIAGHQAQHQNQAVQVQPV